MALQPPRSTSKDVHELHCSLPLSRPADLVGLDALHIANPHVRSVESPPLLLVRRQNGPKVLISVHALPVHTIRGFGKSDPAGGLTEDVVAEVQVSSVVPDASSLIHTRPASGCSCLRSGTHHILQFSPPSSLYRRTTGFAKRGESKRSCWPGPSTSPLQEETDRQEGALVASHALGKILVRCLLQARWILADVVPRGAGRSKKASTASRKSSVVLVNHSVPFLIAYQQLAQEHRNKKCPYGTCFTINTLQSSLAGSPAQRSGDP
eukprot:758443-Hanusia_phi.AAC.6